MKSDLSYILKQVLKENTKANRTGRYDYYDDNKKRVISMRTILKQVINLEDELTHCHRLNDVCD